MSNDEGPMTIDQPLYVSTTLPIEVAQYLAQQFAARAGEAGRLGQLPVENVQPLKHSGSPGLSVPQKYGGQGLPMKDCLAAQPELAQGNASTAMVAGMPLKIYYR
jgi:alkylation response protein AidB-like acyl-CoA dehydrogenase